jgi:hypothetical protein
VDSSVLGAVNSSSQESKPRNESNTKLNRIEREKHSLGYKLFVSFCHAFY